MCRRNSLAVHVDTIADGFWVNCDRCVWAGDLIELASKCWGVDLPTAIARLRPTFPQLPDSAEELARYVGGVVEHRQRVGGLWRQSKERFESAEIPRSIMPSLDRLGVVRDDGSPTEWIRHASGLLGCATKDEIEKTFHPSVMTAKRNSSAYRVFRGPHWDNLAVIPFEDMPGRICGFLFIGRQATDDDIVSRRVCWGHNHNRLAYDGVPAEFGLAGRRWVEASDVNQALAVNDPFLAYSLQSVQARNSGKPAPVVLWHDALDGQTRDSWRMLTERPIVFWTNKEIDPVLMSHAMLTDSKISTAPWLKDFSLPSAWIKHVWTNGRSWPQVMSKLVRTLAPHDLQAFLTPLQHRFPDVEQRLADALPRDDRNLVRQALAKLRPLVRMTVFDGKTILETPDGWSIKRAGRPPELISDAQLRIDRIVRLSQKDLTYYQGVITFRSHQVEFKELASEVEADPADWMNRRLMDAGVGSCLQHKSWSKHLVSIARRFAQPEFLKGVESAGWCEARRSFVLPGFEILRKGDSRPFTGYVTGLAGDPAYRPPGPLTVEERQRLLAEPGGPTTWATLGSLLAMLSAPIFSRQPLHTLLAGELSTPHGVLAAAGCPSLSAGALTDKITAALEQPWPTTLRPACVTARREAARLHELRPAANFLSPADALAATAAGASGKHWVVWGQPDDPLPSWSSELVPRLIVGYLANLRAHSHLFSDQNPTCWLSWTFDRLSGWLSGCNTGVSLSEARQLVVSVELEDRVKSFVECLVHLILAGQLDVVSSSVQKAPGRLRDVVIGPDAVTVAQKGVLASLRRLGVSPIVFPELRAAVGGPHESWTVSRELWERFSSKASNRAGRLAAVR